MPESEPPHITLEDTEKFEPEIPSADTDRTALEKETLKRWDVSHIDSLQSLQFELATLVGKYIRKYYDKDGNIIRIDASDDPPQDDFLKGLPTIKPEHPGLS